ncbi:MAG: hypothetical protein WBG70_24790 [Spirulinaceae cyanobacterium]
MNDESRSPLTDAIETATEVGEIVGSIAFKTGQAAIELASELGETATAGAQGILEQATQSTGETLAGIAENPVIKFINGKFGNSWLKSLLGKVDIQKALERVKALQQEYPNATPKQIAHRLMVQKAIRGAGIGVATNFIPPLAAALFALDLAATAQLQAELIYEIAAVYDLDLEDPSRRGEVLAIFGLALGGSGFVKTGLSFAEVIPGAGLVIGASTNAVMLYGLGQAAYRYYEAKQDPTTAPATVEAIQQESEAYFQTAIEQQEIMDRILVHMLLASYPDKSWSDIVPELQKANLPPKSVEAMANHIKKPQPLEKLLRQLSPDLVPPLLARCQQIALLDGQITPAEEQVLEAIKKTS